MAGNRTLKLSLLADSKEFGQGLRDGETKLQRFGRTVGKVGKGVAVGGAAIAGLGVAAFGAAQRVAEAGDAVAKGAERIGVSTDAYQELDYWASQNGISQDRMERAVGRLNQRIGDAASGTGKYAEAFSNLGVNLRDSNGDLRDTETVLAETVANLSAIEDPAMRADAAADVFGQRMGRELMPALADGALSLEDAATKANELGLVMGEDAVESAVKFQDAWDTLKRSAEGMFRDAAVPIMEWFADTFMPLVQDRIVPALQRFSEWIGPILTDAGRDMSAFFQDRVIPVVRDLWAWFQDRALPVIKDVARFIRDEFIPRFQAVVAVLAERLIPVFQNVWSTIQSVIDGVRTVAQPVIDALKDAFDRVSEALGGSGSGEGLTNFLEGMWDVISEVAAFIAEHVAPVVGDVLGGAIEATTDFVVTFIEAIQRAWDWLQRLGRRISDVATSIRNSPVGQFASTVASGVGGLMGRASGGVAAAGRPYLVGERGPELFVPSGSGRVVPTSQTGTGGVVINVTGTMLDPEGVARAVQQAIRRSNGRVGALR
ncbi:MAG: hypothetical protein ACLFV0_11210 [Nitriliruptoraceae bacterium]